VLQDRSGLIDYGEFVETLMIDNEQRMPYIMNREEAVRTEPPRLLAPVVR
jgi:hypothetical protein